MKGRRARLKRMLDDVQNLDDPSILYGLYADRAFIIEPSDVNATAWKGGYLAGYQPAVVDHYQRTIRLNTEQEDQLSMLLYAIIGEDEDDYDNWHRLSLGSQAPHRPEIKAIWRAGHKVGGLAAARAIAAWGMQNAVS